jgi:hypothetical protein
MVNYNDVNNCYPCPQTFLLPMSPAAHGTDKSTAWLKISALTFRVVATNPSGCMWFTTIRWSLVNGLFSGS